MALHTLLTRTDADAIGTCFGIQIDDLQGLKAGSVNSNYRITSADGTLYFLRVYEEQDATGAHQEGQLLRWLFAQGIPTVCPLAQPNSDQYLTSINGKATALFPWIEGSSRCHALVASQDAFNVGAFLARVHVAGSPFVRPGRFRTADLLQRCEQIHTRAEPHLAVMGRQLATLLQETVAKQVPLTPRGLCHGDLFRDNILWQENRLVALLDFESAADGCLMFDLGVTLLAWCFHADFVAPLAASLVAGYRSVREILPAERSALFYETQLAALRFTVTRITDYAMRSHLGVTEQRDWQRFFLRFQRLQALGPSGLLSLLHLEE